MTIDPELDAFNRRVNAEVPPAAAATPAARRARFEAVVRRFPAPPDDIDREDHWLVLAGRELLLRCYRPRAGKLPTMLYLHGGGWVAGSVQTHDGACAALSRDADAVVCSLQYRRAPESPWPAPNDDGYEALRWIAQHAGDLGIDETRIGVGGDSAGAHLAAGIALEARDRGGPGIALQLLVYPAIEPDFETASYREHALTGTLTRADMIEYWRHYLPDLARADSRALPGRASLAGLPPACVVVAGMDPLRDDGLRFAAQLRAAQVRVTLLEAPTQTHGFLRAAPYVASARRVQREFGEVVRAALRA